MNEKNLKLLQIYFSESQRKVIQSHKVIQDNIDGFIEAYSALSLSGALDNSVYQIIYPIRRSLDYIHGLRLKSKDQALEKINESFEKLTVLNSRTNESLIFINLLFSEGKLPLLIDQVNENLSRKPVESLAQSATTHDLYESMLLISNTNLQVLNRLKLAENHANNREKSSSERLPIIGTQSSRESMGDSDSAITEYPSGSSSSDSDTEVEHQNTALSQQSLFGIREQPQGASEAGESSLGGTPDEKPLAGALDTERLFNQEAPLAIEALLAKHPSVVVEKFVSLMESINDGKKAIYHSLEIQALSIETPEDEPITKVYLGKITDKEQKEWYNLLDSQGDYVSSANWRIASLIKDDLKQYVDEVRRAFLEVELKTLFGEIFDLASQSEDATIFLKSIAESQGLKSPTGRKLMQKLFGIALEDTREERLEKFTNWYNTYKKQENDDAETTLRNRVGAIPTTAPTEFLQPVSTPEPVGDLSKPASTNLYGSSGEIESNGDRRETSHRDELVTSHTETLNVEIPVDATRFYLEEVNSNKFNTSQRLQGNLKALILLNDLFSDVRQANDAEKKILSEYVGFGGLKDILLNPDIDANWGESNKQYRESIRATHDVIKQLEGKGFHGLLLSVQSTILDAFYTSETVIKGVYDGLKTLGFTGGEILEPSAGIGNFIGYMPKEIRENSLITQVEIDPISAHINQQLYQDTEVFNRPFQGAKIPYRNYDLVVSNIPFGDTRVYDRGFKGDLSVFQQRIHNYFVAKSLLVAKEGAIVALVVSKRLLDSPGNQPIREFIERNGTFLGAVRLPHKTFENANTQVNADILFIQRTAPKLSEEINSVISQIKRIETQAQDGTPAFYDINEYFLQHPEQILGAIKLGGMYDQNDYKVLGELDGDVLSTLIQNTLQKSISEGKLVELSQNETLEESWVEITHLDDIFAKVKNGSIGVDDGVLYKKDHEENIIEIHATEPIEKIEAYLAIKDSLMDLIEGEYTGLATPVLDDLRTQTRELHRSFIEKYGNYDVSLKKITRLDEDYYNVMSLQDHKGREAAILHQATISPQNQVNQVSDISDAITLSLYERNYIDLAFIEKLTNKSTVEILSESQGLIFYDLQQDKYVHRDEYLSGDVKAKHRFIQEVITQGNTEYQTHLESLEQVLPKDIPSNLIEVSLGARWIPTSDYNEFIRELLQIPKNLVTIHYNKAMDDYSVLGQHFNTLTKGVFSTSRLKDTEIIEYAFRMEAPVIRDKVSSNPDRYVVNKEETALAAEKIASVKEKFGEWIWKSAERRERLGQIYNDLFNTTVLRKYDGSHLNFEGLNGINFYDHQKDAIWRLLQNNGGIVDHIVGGGKTFIMVGGTMKMKQLGIVKKPMIIALKSTVPQIVDAYRQAYPLANILAPSENDFKKENRLALFSKIAINDWDCVIMTHDNFNTIPQSNVYEEQLSQSEIEELRGQIDEIELDAGLDYRERKRLIGRVMSQIKKVEARLERLLDRAKDNTLTFQQMGIDHLMVDESQQFKNLAYTSKIRNVAGMSKQEGSKRAFNLLVAIRSLQDKFGGDKGTTFLSGTPISNSLVEMYLLFKYLRPNKMKALGFDTFDQWATNFAIPKTDIEFSITGEFKPKTRFSEFINVPELAILYTEIADIRNDDNLVLDKPQMLGKGYQVKTLSMNEIQKDFGQRIIEFAKTKDGDVLGLGKLSEGQENAYMLLATNLANKMSIDMRLIDPNAAYDPQGKVGTLTQTVFEKYQESNPHKGTQLIFSDTGTPKNKESFMSLMQDYFQDEVGLDAETMRNLFAGTNLSPAQLRQKLKDELLLDDSQVDEHIEQARNSSEGFNLYQEIKFRLVEKGIPENEVVFIHDYATANKKDELFKKVNEGEIRVVLGSTQKLGTGVNVQERIVALHHIDAPWRPSDMEQRNGRGIRQGNRIAKEFYNNELPIYTYCSELSLDTFKYQLLHTKDFLIRQIKNDSIDPALRVIREMDGDSEGGQSYGEILANLSGNTDILEKIRLETLINKLEKSKKSFEAEVFDAIEKAKKIASLLPENEKNIEKTFQDVLYVQEHLQKREDPILNTHRVVFEGLPLNGAPIESRKEYGEVLHQMIHDGLYMKQPNEVVNIAQVYGLNLQAQKYEGLFTKGVEIRLWLTGPSETNYQFNYSSIPGVMVNSMEKTLLSFEQLLQTQQAVLERNKEKVADYQELSTRTWNKHEELQEAKDKLKEVLARLHSEPISDTKELGNTLAIEPSENLATSTSSSISEKNEDVLLSELLYFWSIDDERMKAHQTALEKLTRLTQEGVMASMHALTASDLRINWFETGFESLPKASKFIHDASPTQRLFMDIPKEGQLKGFMAISNDYVLVLPPTKSQDYRLLNLPSLTYQECKMINQEGKYDYQIYPKAYAEKFVNKQIDDTLDLLKHLPEKKNQLFFQEQLQSFLDKEGFQASFASDELQELMRGKLSRLLSAPKSNMTDQEHAYIQKVLSHEGFEVKVFQNSDVQNRTLALTQIMTEVMQQVRASNLDLYRDWANLPSYKTELQGKVIEQMNFPSQSKEAKVQLISRNLTTGALNLELHTKQTEVHIPDMLKKQLTDEESSQLQAHLPLTKIVYLQDKSGGIVKPHYVAVDPELNKVFMLAINQLKLPEQFYGIVLTEEHKTSLKNGQEVLLESLQKSEHEPRFDAVVRVDASKRSLVMDSSAAKIEAFREQSDIETPAFYQRSMSVEQKNVVSPESKKQFNSVGNL